MQIVVIWSNDRFDILCQTEDRRPASARKFVYAPFTLFRLLSYVGLTDAEIDTIRVELLRHGGVRHPFTPVAGRKNLLGIYPDH